MEVYLLLSLTILVLVSAIFALIVLRERDHDRWAVERHELNAMLISKTPSEYIALKRAEKEVEETKKPEELTTNYDGAWVR